MTDVTPRYDYFHQELNVGDSVIYGTTSEQPRGFDYGVIIRFTPKLVEVRCDSNPYRFYQDNRIHKVKADQLCKVDPELLTFKNLCKTNG